MASLARTISVDCGFVAPRRAALIPVIARIGGTSAKRNLFAVSVTVGRAGTRPALCSGGRSPPDLARRRGALLNRKGER